MPKHGYTGQAGIVLLFERAPLSNGSSLSALTVLLLSVPASCWTELNWLSPYQRGSQTCRFSIEVQLAACTDTGLCCLQPSDEESLGEALQHLQPSPDCRHEQALFLSTSDFIHVLRNGAWSVAILVMQHSCRQTLPFVAQHQ